MDDRPAAQTERRARLLCGTLLALGVPGYILAGDVGLAVAGALAFAIVMIGG